MSNHPNAPQESPPPPQGLTVPEMLGIAFSFLWFHRNIVFGLVAIYVCYQVIRSSSDKVTENRQRDHAAEHVALERLPSSQTPFESELQVDRSPPLESIPSNSAPTKPPRSDATIKFRQFLETATTEQLLARCKSLVKDISRMPAVQGVADIRRRQQICQHLRTMDLSAEHALDVEVIELESLSQLNALNVQHQLGLPDSQSRLIDVALQMANHPDTTVAAKANLAIIAAEGVDVFIKQTNDELQQFVEAYGRHIDPVLAKPEEAVVVASLLQRIFAVDPTDERLLTLYRDFSQRLRSQPSPQLQAIGMALEEKANFGEFGLDSLLTRMNAVTEATQMDIRNFYVALADHPDSRLEIYKMALAVIGKHMINDRYEDAAIAFDALRRIQPNIVDQQTSTFVAEKMNQFEVQLQALADSQAASF